MNGLTDEQQRAINALISAVVDAVQAAGPMGAPGSSIYLALEQQGFTFDQCNRLMSIMVKRKILRCEHWCYHLGEALN